MVFDYVNIFMGKASGVIDGKGADRYGKFTIKGTVKDQSDGWGSSITFEA